MDSKQRRRQLSEDDGTIFSLRLFPADRDNVNTILRHLVNNTDRGPMPNSTTAIRYAIAEVAKHLRPITKEDCDEQTTQGP